MDIKALENAKTIRNGFFFSMTVDEIADYFHPISCETFAPNDDNYHFNIRGDHYVIIRGWSEMTSGDLVMIIGNHKGNLAYTIKKLEH